MQIKGLPGFHKGPIGNAKATKRERDGRPLVQLDRDGWLAYPLPIAKTDEPHLLEIQYPANLRQTLGISIVEPNAAGKVAPIGLTRASTFPNRRATRSWHVIGWCFRPHTKTPLVLLSQSPRRRPGDVRQDLGAGRPCRAASAAGDAAGRPRADRLLRQAAVSRNFGAIETLDPASHGTLDDWTTFHAGSKRLVEDPSTPGSRGPSSRSPAKVLAIYPSRLLRPTPKYDTGVFFSTGQDPVRKDVLELMFRMFDREGLKLTPAIQFASPLPELEEERRTGGDAGLEWINANGLPWAFGARHATRPGPGPQPAASARARRDAPRRGRTV